MRDKVEPMRLSAVRQEPEAPGLHDATAGPGTRAFWLLLLVIASGGLAIRLYVGWKNFLDFDEWQHVFMASGARWSDVAFELRTNAHPPLFFLLLRPLVFLVPRNAAVYRTISIAAGAGSVVVVGLIARKVLDSPVIQLLCAAAFALSRDAIAISDEIRSYQLAVFLVLLAFLFWLEMFSANGANIRKLPFVAFAITASLAVSSHYSAVFFLGASVVVSLLLCTRQRKRSRWMFALAMAVPCAVFGLQYFIHAAEQPIQGYLYDFYRGLTPGESAAGFVVRNSRNFLNLFSPLELRSTTAFVPVLLLIVAASAWTLSKQWRSRKRAAAAILLAGIMVFELLLASLLQKYPFGGMLRHQYIAGPFVLIAAFVALDCLLTLTPRRLRYAIPALLLAASIANFVAEEPKLILHPGAVLVQDEFNTWRSAFPDANAVYLDHWGVQGYFIHTRGLARTFVRRISDPAVIDEYHVSGGPDIFYDKSRDSLDFSDPSVYRSFAACLRDSGAKELSLFFFSPGNRPFPTKPGKMQDLVTQRAAEQGLITTKVVATGTYLFAGFKLADSE